MKYLVIIGGGPGGYVAAIRARQLGLDTCLVEKDQLGGTCLNRGCIPTKAYYQNAMVMHTLHRLAEYNVAGGPFVFDMAGAYERKNKVVSGLRTGITQLLKGYGVEVVTGEAAISAPGRVLVNGQTIECRRILIATGSKPAVLPVEGADLPGVMTSDEFLDLNYVPPRLAIIGGGVIGLEFACIMNAFGSQVTIIEFLPDILNLLDKEIVKRMTVYLKKQGINLFTSTLVQRIEKTGEGLRLTAEGKKGEVAVEADVVLMAAGRKPCTDNLGLEDLGVQTQKGFITVDKDFQTSVPGIYAVGDVIGGPMLAHVASEEGIVAVERMTGINSEVAYHAVPGCIFSLPEIATVGMSEEEVRAAGVEPKIGKFLFAANGKAMAMGETDGLVKVIAGEDQTVLGIHILGPHASDLIQEASLIVNKRMKLSEVREVIHPHPTLGEALAEALMDAARMSIHQLPKNRG